MPNVDAANISYNLLRVAAGNGITVGGILLGAARPVHILTPSSTVRRIVNMTALAVVDAGAQRDKSLRRPTASTQRTGSTSYGQPSGKPLYKSLYFQVIVAIVIGVLLGHFYPETGAAMKPLGDGFIKLIKMIIAPIIFCTVVVGIAGMEDMKKVGKTGGYALLYFEIVSTIALIVGLVIVNLVQPGAGMNIDAGDARHQGHRRLHRSPARCRARSTSCCNVIPNTVVDAFAKGEILQVLLFSVLFGFALHKLRRPRHAGVRLHREDLARAVRDRRLHHEGGARSARSARWPSRSASTASARWCRSAS